MPREDWVANTVERIFEAEGLYPTGQVKSVLDVACGLSLKSQYITADIRVGVDIYRPYLEKIQADVPYATVLAEIADADFAAEIAPFRQPTTRGGFLVRWVLGGCAAYRTQLFCYLKSCGREELSTWDLWQGMDAPPKA